MSAFDEAVGRFDEAVRRFEALHREDPRVALEGGVAIPYSLHYHRRLGHWLGVRAPNASEPLRLSAACQHLRRWTVARDTFPAGLAGYKRWRSHLARFHGDEAAAVLGPLGYDAATIARVRELLIKKGLKSDPEVQALEDAVCLVFIENELAEFAKKHAEAKVLDILRKTWAKMSPEGHSKVLAAFGGDPLLARALG